MKVPRVGVPLLRIANLSKTFGDAKVLDGVSMEVHAREIVAIVGQNGSGKSTLVKILAGIHAPDPGATIELRDNDGVLQPTHGSHHQSLHFIHQDLGLLPMLSTTENLDLGRDLGAKAVLPARRRAEHQRASDLVGRFGAEIDVEAPVGELSPAERAIVAIARAMEGWTRTDNILILDEPTTAFQSEEVTALFEAIRRVAAGGAGIIFISHRLDEVHDLADRVVALRDGKKICEVESGGFDTESLVQTIVGAAVDETHLRGASLGETMLAVRGVSGAKVRDVTFTVRSGEIVGVTGVLGSGREELGGILFGALKRRSGTVEIGGRPLRPADVTEAIEQGVAFVPADRHRAGAVMSMTMRENLTLPSMAGLRRRFGRLDATAEQAESHRWAQALELRPPEPDRLLAEFSGGNQQKIVLAKWLRIEPRVLILEEPTQGVDVGAKAAIYGLIGAAARNGTAVLICSSDAKEVAAICDRVIVFEAGVVVREAPHGDLTEEMVLRASLGLPAPTTVTFHEALIETERT
ncbi:MAG: sugar ABC transporter ATP-binding protein [Acidimicrobiales bacterium]